MDRRHFCFTSSALALAAFKLHAAEPFPTKSVRIISPYAAGGRPDFQLRQSGPVLGDALGQPIVIEKKVGAAGVIAAQYVAQQPPDGYTLLIGSNTHLIQKILQPNLRFDPITDFIAVSNLTSSPTVLVVRTESPYQTLEELIADAKAKPGSMNYGSGGIGTSAHLGGATLASLNRLRAVHIPLKGSVEIAASLLRGDTQFAFPVAGTAVPQVKGGRLRALAVTSRQRLKLLPDVPTLYERLKNELAVQESWFGLWAPAGTPGEIVTTIHAAVSKTVRTLSVQTAFEAAGNKATLSESPQAFAEFVRSENRKWAEIVKLADITGGS